MREELAMALRYKIQKKLANVILSELQMIYRNEKGHENHTFLPPTVIFIAHFHP